MSLLNKLNTRRHQTLTSNNLPETQYLLFYLFRVFSEFLLENCQKEICEFCHSMGLYYCSGITSVKPSEKSRFHYQFEDCKTVTLGKIGSANLPSSEPGSFRIGRRRLSPEERNFGNSAGNVREDDFLNNSNIKSRGLRLLQQPKSYRLPQMHPGLSLI